MSLRLTIDGKSCEVAEGITVLQAARSHQIDIPTLCDCPGLPSRGSCRMCMVEINVNNRASTSTACTTPVEEGMVVQTHSPRIQALRGELMQMLLADHPSSCLFCPEKSHCDECMVTLRKTGMTTGCRSCPKDGQCELQAMVRDLELTQTDYPTRYRALKVHKDDPFIDRDYNLCILCGRCVRTCESLHFASAINFIDRGPETVIGTAYDGTLLESGCHFCGACVEVCPTGSLTEKTRKWSGAPDQKTASTCPLCSAGCQIELLSKNNMVFGSLPNREAGTNALCVLGRFGITELVSSPDRLAHPQILKDQKLKNISWEDAIQAAADRFSACPPEEFEMLVSSSMSNENLFIAQKFCHDVMHSQNIHAPELDALGSSLGIVSDLLKRSEPISILDEAETIVCLGLDANYVQSNVEVALHRATQRGAKILAIDASDQTPGEYADLWLQPAPGGETSLLEKIVIQRELPQPWSHSGDVEQAARFLLVNKAPIFIIGHSWLDQPDRRLLEAVKCLADRCNARLIALPGAGNLQGALRIGIFPAQSQTSDRLRLLYVVGETIPESVTEGAAILYQNIHFSPSARNANLVLPAAAFSEEPGSMIDAAGIVHEIKRAVDPPGEALPSWEIICRIAQKMGFSNFGYRNVEEIRQEMAKNGVDLTGKSSLTKLPFGLETEFEAVSPAADPAPLQYLGLSLVQHVAGLRALNLESRHV